MDIVEKTGKAKRIIWEQWGKDEITTSHRQSDDGNSVIYRIDWKLNGRFRIVDQVGDKAP